MEFFDSVKLKDQEYLGPGFYHDLYRYKYCGIYCGIQGEQIWLYRDDGVKEHKLVSLDYHMISGLIRVRKILVEAHTDKLKQELLKGK